MGKLYTALGLMSGTSMDGVDASIIKSDGERVYSALFACFIGCPVSPLIPDGKSTAITLFFDLLILLKRSLYFFLMFLLRPKPNIQSIINSFLLILELVFSSILIFNRFRAFKASPEYWLI